MSPMTDDLRDRLQDLAGEMPALHAPRNLEARVRRREVGVAGAAVLGVLIIVAATLAGVRSFDRGGPDTVNPATNTFPVAGQSVSATQAVLQAPEGLMVGGSGDLYISEWYGNKIDVLAHGSIGTIAGTGSPGYFGDNGPATSAEIDSPTAMALEPDGSLLFVDNNNGCIRRIDPHGTITRVAGRCGFEGYSGDNGPALDAKMSRPLGLVLDPNGGFYFSDNDFGLVRHVDANGTMSTVSGAGTVSPADIGPDGVPAASVDLGRTSYLLMDPQGNVYVSDLRLCIVLKIDPSGTATVFAGTSGKAGYSGDGGPATQSELNFPAGLATDHRGDVYISDMNNNVIRMVDPNGVIHTVAGTGVAGYRGDG